MLGKQPVHARRLAAARRLEAARRAQSQPDETPGNVSYTTVRSLTDETVQPQGGRHPTSALEGATNILIQAVCPGRQTTHIGTAIDSVTFAAFADAVAHRGPAKVSRACPPTSARTRTRRASTRQPRRACSAPPGGDITSSQSAAAPKLAAEPRVRNYVERLPR